MAPIPRFKKRKTTSASVSSDNSTSIPSSVTTSAVKMDAVEMSSTATETVLNTSKIPASIIQYIKLKESQLSSESSGMHNSRDSQLRTLKKALGRKVNEIFNIQDYKSLPSMDKLDRPTLLSELYDYEDPDEESDEFSGEGVCEINGEEEVYSVGFCEAHADNAPFEPDEEVDEDESENSEIEPFTIEGEGGLDECLASVGSQLADFPQMEHFLRNDIHFSGNFPSSSPLNIVDELSPDSNIGISEFSDPKIFEDMQFPSNLHFAHDTVEVSSEDNAHDVRHYNIEGYEITASKVPFEAYSEPEVGNGQIIPHDDLDDFLDEEEEPGTFSLDEFKPKDVDKLFFYAVTSNHFDMVKLLLSSKKFNINERSMKEMTPLMEAASQGHLKMVELLCEYNADVNCKNTQGNTALMHACAMGHLDVVKELMKHGASVEEQNENGHTCLMEAASAGHVEIVAFLIEHGANINVHSNEYKETALTLAAYKGHLEVVRLLIEACVDYDLRAEEMHTALMEASMDGHVEVAKLLIDSGAMVNMPPDNFESPLTLAACGGHVELALLLLQRGANIEEVNDEGYNALMEASREGHEEMVALLLTNNAVVNAMTEESKETALCMASSTGNIEVVKLLLRAGADVNFGSSTPLMEAAQEGHLDIAKMLLWSNAKINCINSAGDTALSLAAENGHLEIVKLLLQYKADVNHTNKEGRTPLMKAAFNGHLEIASMLIHANARVNQATYTNDHTALSLACNAGHARIVDLLLLANADVKHRLKDNATMLIEASKGGHTDIVTKLINWSIANPSQEIAPPTNLKAGGAQQPHLTPQQQSQQKKTTGSVAKNSLASKSKATTATDLSILDVASSLDKLKAYNDKCVSMFSSMESHSFEKLAKFAKEAKTFAQETSKACRKAKDLNLANELKRRDDEEGQVFEQIKEETVLDADGKIIKKLPMAGLAKLTSLGMSRHKELEQLVKRQDELVGKLSDMNPMAKNKPRQGLVLKKWNADTKKLTTSGNDKKKSSRHRSLSDTLVNKLLIEQQKIDQSKDSLLDHIKTVVYVLVNEPNDFLKQPRREEDGYLYISDHIVASIFLIIFRHFLMPKIKQPLVSDDDIFEDLFSEIASLLQNESLEESQVGWLRGRFQMIKELKQHRFTERTNHEEPEDKRSLSDTFLNHIRTDGYEAVIPGYVLYKYVNNQALKLHYHLPSTHLNSLATLFSKAVKFQSHLHTFKTYATTEDPVIEMYRQETEDLDGHLIVIQPIVLYHYTVKTPVPAPRKLATKEGTANSAPAAAKTSPEMMTDTLSNEVSKSRETPRFCYQGKPIVQGKPINPEQLIFGIVGNKVWPLAYLEDTFFDIFKKMSLCFIFSDKDDSLNELFDSVKKISPNLADPMFIPNFKNEEAGKVEDANEDDDKLLDNDEEEWNDTEESSNGNTRKPTREEIEMFVAARGYAANPSQTAAAVSLAPKSAENSSYPEEIRDLFPDFLVGESIADATKTPGETLMENYEFLPPVDHLEEKVDENNVIMHHLPHELFKFSEREGGSLVIAQQKLAMLREKLASLQKSTDTLPYLKPDDLKDILTFFEGCLEMGTSVGDDETSEDYSVGDGDDVEYIEEEVGGEEGEEGEEQTVILEGPSKTFLKVDMSKKSKVYVQDPNIQKTLLNFCKLSPVSISSEEVRKIAAAAATVSINTNTTSTATTVSAGGTLWKGSCKTQAAPPCTRIRPQPQPRSNKVAAMHQQATNNAPIKTTEPTTKGKQKTDSKGNQKTTQTNAATQPASVSLDVNLQTDSNHDTALTLACAGGHVDVVKVLLAQQANIELRDKKGLTPLMIAATHGHAVVVEFLCANGANLEAQTERTKDTALSLACSSGRYEVVDILLPKGANKEHRNVSDYTPLSLAASGGYVNIIKLLLSAGAEINSRTGSKLGISPLMLAAMNGHTEAVRLLLDRGSDINASIETNRNTALTLACFQGRTEVVSLLLERNANIEHRAKTGLTPLMEAASGGFVDVGRVLLDMGADVNAPPVPANRDTALTIAADKGHAAFIELLVEKGAMIDAKNKKGYSAIWLACNGGHFEVIRLLVDANCDCDTLDNRKISCLMAAVKKGHIDVVKFLVKHVTQLPSDQEIDRCLSLLASDEELQKKAKECSDVIQQAKAKQAAEANKNAAILLGQIEVEKSREENRKAAAARRRERRKQKKKGKDEDGDKKGSKDDGFDEVTPSIDDDDDIISMGDLDDEDNAPILELMVDLVSSKNEKKKNKKKAKKNKEKAAKAQETTPTVPVSPSKSKTDESKSGMLEASQTKKEVEDIKIKKISVDVVSTTATNATSKGDEALLVRSIQSKTATTTTPPNTQPICETFQAAAASQSCATATTVATSVSVSLPVNSRSAKLMGTTSNKNDKLHFCFSVTSSHAPPTATTTTTASSNMNSSHSKRDDGWKEVSRKSKKVTVPANAISRVIGRGGSNINLIRELSSAHIEVEKQKGQNDRLITIRGSTEATRIAHLLITSLANEADKELPEIIQSLGLEELGSPTSSAAAFTATTGTLSTTATDILTTIPGVSESIISDAASRNKLVTSRQGISSKTTLPTTITTTAAAWKVGTIDSKQAASSVSYNAAVSAKNRNTSSTATTTGNNDKPAFFLNKPTTKINSVIFKPTKLQVNTNVGASCARSQHSASNTSPSTTSSSTSTTSREVDKSEIDLSNSSQKSMMFSTSSAASSGSASSSECNSDYVQFNSTNTIPPSSLWQHKSIDKPNILPLASMQMPSSFSSGVDIVDESKAPGYNRHFASPASFGHPSNASSNASFNGMVSSLTVNTAMNPSSNASSQLNNVGVIGSNVRSAPCTPPIASNFNRSLSKYNSPQHLPEPMSANLDVLSSAGIGKSSDSGYLGVPSSSELFGLAPGSSFGMPTHSIGLNGIQSSNANSLFHTDDMSTKYNNNANSMHNSNMFFNNNTSNAGATRSTNFGDMNSNLGFYGADQGVPKSSMRTNLNPGDYSSSSSRLPGHNSMLNNSNQYNPNINSSNISSAPNRPYLTGSAPPIANPVVRSAILNYSMNVFQPNIPKQHQEAAARLAHLSSQNSNNFVNTDFGGAFSAGGNNTSTTNSTMSNEKMRMMQFGMNQSRPGMTLGGGGGNFQQSTSNVGQQQSNFYGLSKPSIGNSNFAAMNDLHGQMHNNGNNSFLNALASIDTFSDDLNSLRSKPPAPIGTERAQRKCPQQPSPLSNPMGSMLSANSLDSNVLLAETSLWNMQSTNDVSIPDLLHSGANDGYPFESLNVPDFQNDLLESNTFNDQMDFSMWQRQSRFNDQINQMDMLSSGGGGFGASNSASNSMNNAFSNLNTNGDAFHMSSFSNNKMNLTEPTDSFANPASSICKPNSNVFESKTPQWSNWNN